MNKQEISAEPSAYKKPFANKKPLASLAHHTSAATTWLTYLLITITLSACSPSHKIINPIEAPSNTRPISQPTPHQNSYQCQEAKVYQSLVVGDGHCVSLIRKCSLAPHTSLWKQGPNVLSLPQGSIKKGTIIATFKNGRYPNITGYHAAIYIEHTEQGIWVWDQWLGKPVHKRLIRSHRDNATPSNTAQAYSLVQ